MRVLLLLTYFFFISVLFSVPPIVYSDDHVLLLGNEFFQSTPEFTSIFNILLQSSNTPQDIVIRPIIRINYSLGYVNDTDHKEDTADHVYKEAERNTSHLFHLDQEVDFNESYSHIIFQDYGFNAVIDSDKNQNYFLNSMITAITTTFQKAHAKNAGVKLILFQTPIPLEQQFRDHRGDFNFTSDGFSTIIATSVKPFYLKLKEQLALHIPNQIVIAPVAEALQAIEDIRHTTVPIPNYINTIKPPHNMTIQEMYPENSVLMAYLGCATLYPLITGISPKGANMLPDGIASIETARLLQDVVQEVLSDATIKVTDYWKPIPDDLLKDVISSSSSSSSTSSAILDPTISSGTTLDRPSLNLDPRALIYGIIGLLSIAILVWLCNIYRRRAAAAEFRRKRGYDQVELAEFEREREWGDEL